MKEPKRLSWKPYRRGDIYCSPACGGRCTYAEYQKAIRDAERTRKQMDKPELWVARIHENLGWHWCLYHKSSNGLLSLNHTCDGTFYALISLTCPGAGDGRWSSGRYFFNPQLAVNNMVSIVNKRLKQDQQRADLIFQNL